MIEVKTKVQISLSRVEDLLAGAFEGGSNYWYMITDYHKPKVISKHSSHPECTHCSYPISDGGAVVLKDIEDDDSDKRWLVNLATIGKGLQVMAKKYPEHFNNIIIENDDAETADVFLQCVCFGEIVYG